MFFVDRQEVCFVLRASPPGEAPFINDNNASSGGGGGGDNDDDAAVGRYYYYNLLFGF